MGSFSLWHASGIARFASCSQDTQCFDAACLARMTKCRWELVTASVVLQLVRKLMTIYRYVSESSPQILLSNLEMLSSIHPRNTLTGSSQNSFGSGSFKRRYTMNAWPAYDQTYPLIALQVYSTKQSTRQLPITEPQFLTPLLPAPLPAQPAVTACP